MRALFLIFILFNFLFAQDIDSLLQNYAKESDLSKKTKDESAGNLILYTRDDLERMQVESLKDILKSLRFFSYAENRIGLSDIYNQDPLSYYSKSVRIYLNDHELLSSLAGSGLILFGDMEMDFIDHVEIYEGFPSFDFGVEPATIVIRLYSKSAEHDEGGRVKAIVGSYGTNKENVYYTNKTKDLSYFFYANRTDDKKDTYTHDDETLRRDAVTNRFYSSISTQNHSAEFHAMKIDKDAFLGSAVGNVPKDSSTDISYLSLSTSSKFLNNSLKLDLSYINSKSDYASEYTVGKGIPTSPITSFTEYDQTIKEESFTASLKKDWDIGSQALTLGIRYRYKYFDLTNLKFDGIDAGIVQAYDVENIYSVFLEDSITLDSNNLIILSIMDQVYERDGNIDNPNLLQFRFGYIFTNGDWVAKTFISRQQFASEPYMTISPHYGNADLDKETYCSIFQELSYKTDSTLSKMILGYGVNENMAILDQNFKIQNSDIDIKGHSAALEFTLFFSKKDKLELQTSYSYIESPYGLKSTKHYNYTARMLNTVSKFDIYNELTVHSGYSDVSTGYNYSLGVKYGLSKDFHINFKGDNIFDTGLERSYINQVNPVTGVVTDSVVVPVIERRFMFGLEYLF